MQIAKPVLRQSSLSPSSPPPCLAPALGPRRAPLLPAPCVWAVAASTPVEGDGPALGSRCPAVPVPVLIAQVASRLPAVTEISLAG